MSETGYRLGLIEDQINLTKLVEISLRRTAHELLFQIAGPNDPEADTHFAALQPGDLVFTDGNLSGLERDGAQGAEYVQRIKRAQPQAIVIWTSSFPFPVLKDFPLKPDLIITKNEFARLGKFLSALAGLLATIEE